MSDATLQVCARFVVRGRVQGVFFRAATCEQALRFGLTGWVHNCANGDVELVACGRGDSLEQLERWLWQGPARAQVSAVRRVPQPWQDFAEFVVRSG